MNGRTATLIGATGLIGSHLFQLLKEDKTFDATRLLVRRPFQQNDPGVEVKLIAFDDHESFKLGIEGSSVVFCTIGTTQKKVNGNKEAYRKIDFDIPVKAASFCKETGCNTFVLVSSVGADSNSKNFYLRLKGEVEDAVKKEGLKSIHIMRPSILLGNRREFRLGENIGKIAMQAFSFLLFGKMKKYKPIHAKDVAQAMLNAGRQNKEGSFVYEGPELFALSKGKFAD